MKLAYFDCFSGVSGDMSLGACLDLGMDLAILRQELDKLNLPGIEIKTRQIRRSGISGTKADVIVEERGHPHRHLKDIEQIINSSSLQPQVKDLSLKIFSRLAEVEAKIHATSVDQIHFHEVGALDSIVDIVGAAICLNTLEIDEVFCSKINVGTGFVRCQHGIMPVPAPATLELLRGVPIYSYGPEMELVTPTGAAIITAICQNFGRLPGALVEKIGYGAGQRDLEIPNLLRVMLGRRLSAEKGGGLVHHEHGSSG